MWPSLSESGLCVPTHPFQMGIIYFKTCSVLTLYKWGWYILKPFQIYFKTWSAKRTHLRKQPPEENWIFINKEKFVTLIELCSWYLSDFPMLGTSLVFSVKVAKNLSQLLTRREALKQEKKTNVFSNFFYSTRNLCGLRLLDPWCTSVPNKVFYMYG